MLFGVFAFRIENRFHELNLEILGCLHYLHFWVLLLQLSRLLLLHLQIPFRAVGGGDQDLDGLLKCVERSGSTP